MHVLGDCWLSYFPRITIHLNKAYYFLDDTKATIDIMNVIPHSPQTNGAISSGDILPLLVSARTNQLMRIECIITANGNNLFIAFMI